MFIRRCECQGELGQHSSLAGPISSKMEVILEIIKAGISPLMIAFTEHFKKIIKNVKKEAVPFAFHAM